MSTHVVMLMGGWSAERDVSLVTGKACAEALREEGYRVTELDVGRDVAERLVEIRPDVAFNALHGQWGEDGCVQGVLEVMELPYTHSGVRASALAMHKPTARDIFIRNGIPCPKGMVETIERINAADVLERPYVVKPVSEGSTCGVRIVQPGDNQPPIGADWTFGREALAEAYIPGRELSVGVMDGKAMGVVEIKPKSGFYDYDAKYTDGLADHAMPAPVPETIYAKAMELAAQAHRVLDCRGVTRADFRYDDTAGEPGALYMLEINTQPGMTPLSLVPEIAAYNGIDFGALVRWMVEDASCQR